MVASDMYLLPSILINALMLLGLVVALVLAIVRRRHLGRAFPLTIVGTAVLIFDFILGLLFPFSTGLLAEVIDFGSRNSYMGMIGIYNLISAALTALGLGLLIGAAFIGRSGSSPAPAQAPMHSHPPAAPLF